MYVHAGHIMGLVRIKTNVPRKQEGGKERTYSRSRDAMLVGHMRSRYSRLKESRRCSQKEPCMYIP